MNVYLVTYEKDAAYQFIGIYSTKEKAQEAILEDDGNAIIVSEERYISHFVIEYDSPSGGTYTLQEEEVQ